MSAVCKVTGKSTNKSLTQCGKKLVQDVDASKTDGDKLQLSQDGDASKTDGDKFQM